MSTLTNCNEPAYPLTPTDRSGQIGDQFLGLTKREYFAALAMQGMCANSALTREHYDAIAKHAVGHADALLAELAK